MTKNQEKLYKLQQKVKLYKRKDDFYTAEKYESQLELFVMENIKYVCNDCGNEYGRCKEGVVTCNLGPCDLCGRNEIVTAVRNFNYLRV
jgi:hypothetical protein